MVRKYKRKTEKRDDDVIVRALKAVATGMSVRAASKQFDVPETTLRRQWSFNKPKDENDIATATATTEPATTKKRTTRDTVTATVTSEQEPVLSTSTASVQAQPIPSTSEEVALADQTPSPSTHSVAETLLDILVKKPGGQTVCI